MAHPSPSSNPSAGPALPRRAALYTLGCRLNQAETALLADRLRRAGFTLVPWDEPAELLVLNSCTVTGTAARKTRQAVRAARRRCPGAFIVLAGCEADADAGTWAAAAGVNLVVANRDKARLVNLLPATLDPHHRPATAPTATHATPAAPALFVEPGCGLAPERTRAHVKVQEGCSFGCSYCIIPRVRGAPRSRAWDDVLREVRELTERGCRELVLTGVNLALYDDHGRRLPELAAAVLAAAPEARLRLSSLEPGPELAAIVELIAREPRLCRHLHVPLQHGDDRILAAMGRRYRAADYAAFATVVAARVPELCLGTDVIVGFPGEDETAFTACRDLLAALPLAYLHVFTFSPRPGTRAAGLPGRVHGQVARERLRELERLGATAAHGFVRRQVGQNLTVLTETSTAAGHWAGLSDNYLEIELDEAPPALRGNEFVRARLTEGRPGRAARGTWLAPATAAR